MRFGRRTNNMKLALIESGVSRRDFLKRGASGVASLTNLGELGRFLIDNGVSEEIASSIVSGTAIPEMFPFSIMTNTGNENDAADLLSHKLAKVHKSSNIARILASARLGMSENLGNAFIVGQLSPAHFVEILKAASGGSNVKINNTEFETYKSDDEIIMYPIGLSDKGGSQYVQIPLNARSDFVSEIGLNLSKKDNLIKAWWDNYGFRGQELIDPAAESASRSYDIDLSKRQEYLDEINDENYNKNGMSDEEFNFDDEWDEYKGSMHQMFENKLSRVLERLILDGDR